MHCSAHCNVLHTKYKAGNKQQGKSQLATCQKFINSNTISIEQATQAKAKAKAEPKADATTKQAVKAKQYHIVK